MEDADRFNRWARKVFTRLEWSWVYEKVNMVCENKLEQATSQTTSKARLFLPDVSQQIPSDLDARRGLAFVGSPINSLAQSLAGRSGITLAAAP